MSRGRSATRPAQIPPKGLLDVAIRIGKKQGRHNLGLIAAGVAFYGLLSLFPAITAAVALAGLVIDRQTLVTYSEDLAALLPDQAEEIILGQMRDVATADGTALSFAALLALGLALYSASRATGNFVVGLNITNEEVESRGFFKLQAIIIGLTFALLLGLVLGIAVVAVVPALLAFFGTSDEMTGVVMLLRWPVFFALGVAGIAVLYRYGPDRRGAKWRWLTPGAVIACALWVLGTFGFSYYVQSFGTYNETFGTLGGVIVLLTWLWLSAFIVLLGSLVDAELEAQTARDSTIGEDLPRGQRGATKADELGALRGEPHSGAA